MRTLISTQRTLTPTKRTAAIKYTSLPLSTNKPIKANKLFVNISSALILATAALASPTNAASQCKGLAVDACNQNAVCGWVEGYERKDGRSVKSFCRTSRSGISTKAAGAPTAKDVPSKAKAKAS